VHFAHKPTQRLFFLKKVALLAKQSAYVFLVMFAQNVWNMHWHMMNALEFGADSQSVNAAA
jgi:hypothetical protein